MKRQRRDKALRGVYGGVRSAVEANQHDFRTSTHALGSPHVPAPQDV